MTSSNRATDTNDTRAGKKTLTAGKQARPERGFAAMDPKRQREIASEGGKAANLSGNAHQFSSEEARAAGRKGGQASTSPQTGRGKVAKNSAKR